MRNTLFVCVADRVYMKDGPTQEVVSIVPVISQYFPCACSITVARDVAWAPVLARAPSVTFSFINSGNNYAAF